MEAVDAEGCSLSTCFNNFLGTDGFLSALTNRVYKKDELDIKLDGDKWYGNGAIKTYSKTLIGH